MKKFSVIFISFVLMQTLISCKNFRYYNYNDTEINIPVININMTSVLDLENVEKYDLMSLIPTKLEKGVNHQIVMGIQQKLMMLGFMEEDKPTTYYGDSTDEAIKKFQRQINVSEDGVCTPEVYSVLMSKNAPSYETMRGFKGNDIEVIQQRLYELSYLLEEDDINGYFGERTEMAVKALQTSNKLEDTGIVDLNTINLLYSENVVAYTIDKDSQSYIIKKYQERLKELGYYLKECDGVYSSDFKEAVKIYQRFNSQDASGLINPSTKFSIDSKYARPYLIYMGDRSARIKSIQERLAELNYIDKKLITSNYGEYTAQAIAIFQKNNNLPITGLVDGATQMVLDSENPVPAKVKLEVPSQFIMKTKDIRNAMKETKNVGNADDLLKVALLKLGSKYLWGSRGPNKFDCSGFVYWCLNQVGVNVSYMTTYNWRFSTQFERIEKFDDLQVGDLIVVNGHMGIVADNQTVVDASSSNGRVVHRDLDDWWREKFMIGFRIFDNENEIEVENYDTEIEE